MHYVGVGAITGLYGVADVKHAIIVDMPQTFDNIKKGLERITGERTGITGFKSIVGKQAGVSFVLVQAPPYPEAIVEVVSELYLFGVRTVITITRGYKLVKRIPARAALLARGAIGFDGISRKLLGDKCLPLMPSAQLESVFRKYVTTSFTDFSWLYGYTVTVPSPFIRYSDEMVREVSGRKNIAAVDSVTAPLYALQYELSKLEVLSLIALPDNYETVKTSTILNNVDDFDNMVDRIAREETILYMAAVEVLRKLG